MRDSTLKRDMVALDEADGPTPKQLEVFHSIFGPTWDSISESDRLEMLEKQDSLDLQLMSSQDIVSILIDLIMYGVAQCLRMGCFCIVAEQATPHCDHEQMAYR